ncbi:hypothetical protein Salat_2685200 [Sesamum alatum]|uniref:3'-5' exonuclease domain-containing protein n=1 Tax=Sesamum alatum TaxID=300844 RepID=A0AAE1XPP4_9LAMI|nr:hypothetical protein Salat_2685200 [Sesamum alatum]
MNRNIHSTPSNSIIPLRHTISTHLPSGIRTLPNFYSVDFHGKVIEVTVAKKAAHVHQWISHIRYVNRPRHHCKLLVGLDTECCPNFSRGEDHLVAVLQLCVGQHCLIFQLLHTDSIPASLYAFLADPWHTFCGVGVQEDAKKLYDHHSLHVRNVTDLNELITRSVSANDGSENRHMGLSKMALAILGKEMMKPEQVKLSKWDSFILDLDQVEYATINAFVSFQIASALCLWNVD